MKGFFTDVLLFFFSGSQRKQYCRATANTYDLTMKHARCLSKLLELCTCNYIVTQSEDSPIKTSPRYLPSVIFPSKTTVPRRGTSCHAIFKYDFKTIDRYQPTVILPYLNKELHAVVVDVDGVDVLDARVVVDAHLIIDY